MFVMEYWVLECIDSSSYCIMRHMPCAYEVLKHTLPHAPMNIGFDIISRLWWLGIYGIFGC